MKDLLGYALGVAGLLYSSSLLAISFGVFDARSLAMGGAGVATATATNASYYNPAMLAQYNVRKEKGRNSRTVFPTIAVRYSDTLEEIHDFRKADLDGDLRKSITAFNANQNSTTAQSVAASSRALQAGLDEVTKGPFALDANIGIVLGIGGRKEGGALMINVRGVSDGVIIQTPEDRTLINRYVGAMNYYAANNAIAPQYADLFTGGQLNDQTDNLTSSARGTGIVMTELGMSFGREITLFDETFAIGVTPKYVKVDTYDIATNATDQDVTESEDRGYDGKVNIDIGVDKVFNPRWRAGMVVKNLVSRDYLTALNNEVKQEPQYRAGVAYERDWGVLTADLDLKANDAIGFGDDSQVIALGGEWRYRSYLKFLFGYQQNLKATRDHAKGMFGGGISVDYFNFRSQLTYAGNNVETAASLTVIYRF